MNKQSDNHIYVTTLHKIINLNRTNRSRLESEITEIVFAACNESPNFNNVGSKKNSNIYNAATSIVTIKQAIKKIFKYHSKFRDVEYRIIMNIDNIEKAAFYAAADVYISIMPMNYTNDIDILMSVALPLHIRVEADARDKITA